MGSDPDDPNEEEEVKWWVGCSLAEQTANKEKKKRDNGGLLG